MDTLLIVDDCKEFPLIVTGFLAVDDLKVIVKESAREGIDFVMSNGPVSVVISDYQMPLINGVEFLGWIKANCPHTYRVLYSSHSEDFINETEAVGTTVHHFSPNPENGRM
ncbi:MAG: response regulator [Nitrospinae bacterium]|nr:response regulator [Nitrospinota bacterium]